MLIFLTVLFIGAAYYFIVSRYNEPNPKSNYEVLLHYLIPWILPAIGVALSAVLVREGWPELAGVLGYSIYIYIVAFCSRHPYFEVESYTGADRTSSSIRPSLQLFIRTGIFVAMAVVVLMRVHLVFWMFHNDEPSWKAEIVLAVIFSLLVAFWPATSVYLLFYCFILVHVRAIFLVGVLTIRIFQSLAVGSIFALIIFIYLIPISLYVLIGSLGFAFSGDDASNLAKSGFLIAGIALFMMSVRWAYSIINSIRTELTRPIKIIGEVAGNILNRWKIRCQSIYNIIVKAPLTLGEFMGGDIR